MARGALTTSNLYVNICANLEIKYHEKALREYWKLPKRSRDKLNSALYALEREEKLPKSKYKKILNTKLFEIRVKVIDGIFRAIGGYVSKGYVVLSIFKKKSQKLPKRELDKAIRRYKQLF